MVGFGVVGTRAKTRGFLGRKRPSGAFLGDGVAFTLCRRSFPAAATSRDTVPRGASQGGFFVEKVPKRYMFGTGARRNCLTFGGFRATPKWGPWTKPCLGTAKRDGLCDQRVTACFVIRATCFSRQALDDQMAAKR